MHSNVQIDAQSRHLDISNRLHFAGSEVPLQGEMCCKMEMRRAGPRRNGLGPFCPPNSTAGAAVSLKRGFVQQLEEVAMTVEGDPDLVCVLPKRGGNDS